MSFIRNNTVIYLVMRLSELNLLIHSTYDADSEVSVFFNTLSVSKYGIFIRSSEPNRSHQILKRLSSCDNPRHRHQPALSTSRLCWLGSLISAFSRGAKGARASSSGLAAFQ